MFKIISGYRIEKYNWKVGGVRNLSYIKGLVVDIVCFSSKDRFIIVNVFIMVGFNCIGIVKNFVYVDLDVSKF